MIAFRPIQHTFLVKCGLGMGQVRHGEEGADETYEQKGISISETFRPLKTKQEFRTKISQLARELTKRMEKDQLAGLIVHLSLKFTTFASIGKQQRQNKYVWRFEEIQKICYKLLDTFWPCDPIRLIRIRVSDCKNIKDVRKERSIGEFTKKVSADEMQRRKEQELSNLTKQIRSSKIVSKTSSVLSEPKQSNPQPQQIQ